jgi:pyruvate,water dikinase
MENYKFIKFFEQISGSDAKTAGGKAANLGKLAKAGIPVPAGFVILAPVFLEIGKTTDIGKKIEAAKAGIEIGNAESVRKGSEAIKKIIMVAKPVDLEKEALAAFAALGAKRVSVRSSATAEDSKSASWAGQLETNLNVAKIDLIENIKKCWASLYGERALLYAAGQLPEGKNNSVAVIVQTMVNSEVSGVCFTVHPVTQNKKQMVIEAVWGLGESLVQGSVTPDRYVVAKTGRIIEEIDANDQQKMIAKTLKGADWVTVPVLKRTAQKLAGKEIVELGDLCLKIERLYKTPQDIEWAKENGKFYILQTRPITTLK